MSIVVIEATKTVNDILRFGGENLISLPIDGTNKQRLEILLDLYIDKLIAKNPQYENRNNKKEIPDMVVNYLQVMINKET